MKEEEDVGIAVLEWRKSVGDSDDPDEPNSARRQFVISRTYWWAYFKNKKH